MLTARTLIDRDGTTPADVACAHGGDPRLPARAADAGFADQAHLCRVVRAETGTTPSALREALA